METHGILLGYFLILLLGMFAMASVLVVTLFTRDILLRYFLFFFAVYTLEILKAVIKFYLKFNLPETGSVLLSVLEFIQYILHAFSVYSIAMLIHYLVSLPRARLINNIVLACSFFTFGLQMYLDGLGPAYGGVPVGKIYSIQYGDIVFLLFILYVIVLGLMRLKKIEDVQKKIVLKKLLVLGIVFFPGLVYDSLIYAHHMMILAPVIYFFMSVLLFYYLIRFYLKNYYLSSDEVEENRDDLFEKYGISEREKDTLLLLVKGYSNKKIGDTLYISLSTVKSHVYSIFKKTGVTSRYELIHLLKENAPGVS